MGGEFVDNGAEVLVDFDPGISVVGGGGGGGDGGLLRGCGAAKVAEKAGN